MASFLFATIPFAPFAGKWFPVFWMSTPAHFCPFNHFRHGARRPYGWGIGVFYLGVDDADIITRDVNGGHCYCLKTKRLILNPPVDCIG